MAVDTNAVLAKADELGKMLAGHPLVVKYVEAQKAVSQDPDATRLLAEFEKQYERLAQQEATGMAVTDAQRMALEALQQKIASQLKIRAFNMAQYEFIDLLRKVSQGYQKHLADAMGTSASRAASPVAGGARAVRGI